MARRGSWAAAALVVVAMSVCIQHDRRVHTGLCDAPTVLVLQEQRAAVVGQAVVVLRLQDGVEVQMPI